MDITYPTTVDISVIGILTDDAGTQFEGTNQVRVIKPGKGIFKNKEKGGKGGGNGDDGDDNTGENKVEVD